MATRQLGATLRYICGLAASEYETARSDHDLLRAYLDHRDQDAFAALVGRHGPLVLGVCRRVLHDAHGAEDAFQATFLLLARNGAAIRKQGSVASWLYGVAYRVCSNARRSAARRRRHETEAMAMRRTAANSDVTWREVQAVLDEEVQRLPELQRAAFVLCCMENRSCAEAARALGITEGTVWNRLARARKLLRERLATRGVALSALLGVAAVCQDGLLAAVPAGLVRATVQAVAVAGARGAATGVVSAEVLRFMKGANRAMLSTKAKCLVLLLVFVTLIGASFSLSGGEQRVGEPGAGEPPAADKANAAKVDKLFALWDKPGSPGCALGIVRNGKLVMARGYGTANLDDGVPITPQSVFEVGGITTSFTCVCLALLMDQGKLAPDDDIRKYVPEMPRYDPPITIRNLVRCEDGLYEYFHLLQLGGWNIDDAWTPDDALALVTRQKAPVFRPGSRFAYNNTAYLVLVRAIERITGQPLARFADKNLFQPLGMANTYLEDRPERITKHRVVGYDVMANRPTRRWIMNSNIVGISGLKTTVEDLCKWDQNFYANRLPDGPYLRAFLKTGTLLDNRRSLDFQSTDSYRGLKRMSFTGGMPGFVAGVIRFPEQKFSVICLSNDYFRAEPWNLALRIADIYLADQMKAGKTPPNPPAKHAFVDLAESDLQDKAGTYRQQTSRQMWTVAVANGGLALTDRLGEVEHWRPLSPTRFRSREGPHKGTHTLVFERRPDKRFNMGLEPDTGHDNGRSTDFEPVQLVKPNVQQLREYAGEYYSPELKATYGFSVRDGRLFLQVNNHRLEPLAPTVGDEFVAQQRTPDDARVIHFVRDGERRVAGLTIALWRIKGISFDKLPSASR